MTFRKLLAAILVVVAVSTTALAVVMQHTWTPDEVKQNSGEFSVTSKLTVEILGALGIKPQEMDSYFGEGSAGAAIELRLIRFAGAILE
ncbi:MAG: hypothetical protein WCB27_07755, partial [Thermoguttaceae bacterium]